MKRAPCPVCNRNHLVVKARKGTSCSKLPDWQLYVNEPFDKNEPWSYVLAGLIEVLPVNRKYSLEIWPQVDGPNDIEWAAEVHIWLMCKGQHVKYEQIQRDVGVFDTWRKAMMAALKACRAARRLGPEGLLEKPSLGHPEGYEW